MSGLLINQPLGAIDEVPLSYDPNAPRWLMKRLLDIVLSFASLVILSPILAFLCLAIKLTSEGPILYKQIRVGAGGKLFLIYKFRSMIQNADSLRNSLASKNEASGPVFKIRNDPRITPIGRYLRKFSLDELPQLWNILRGEMSIVGPRPPLPNEVQNYQPWQLRRLSVPQGLTCIWQISGRSNVNFDDWVKLDLRYIDSWSLILDLKIIIHTFLTVLRGHGAY
jgi:lipopolysaccharide/colanic/teichoic acid biosynthesis glycosyltransferase